MVIERSALSRQSSPPVRSPGDLAVRSAPGSTRDRLDWSARGLTRPSRRHAPRWFDQAQAEFCSVGGNICETPYKNAFTLAEMILSTGLANGMP